MIIYAIALILLMFYRPQGLFGYMEITNMAFSAVFSRKGRRLMSELLRTENVSEVFGGLKAVTDFNIHLDRGELVGLIGPNGAGKTTAFNMLTGVYQPTTGSITFEGESIVGLKPYQVTQRGIARTFQNIRLFSELTVLENVKIAFHYHVKYGILESVFRIGRYFKEEEAIEQEAHRLLKIFHLDDKPMRSPRTCRTAHSAASRSRALSRPSRSSCCSTSRLPA